VTAYGVFEAAVVGLAVGAGALSVLRMLVPGALGRLLKGRNTAAAKAGCADCSACPGCASRRDGA
jgi:hypothetical protein